MVCVCVCHVYSVHTCQPQAEEVTGDGACSSGV